MNVVYMEVTSNGATLAKVRFGQSGCFTTAQCLRQAYESDAMPKNLREAKQAILKGLSKLYPNNMEIRFIISWE